MKFNLLAISALAAIAAAATETTSSDNAAVTLGPEAKCANKCDVTDRCCIAACYRVPCPSDSQVNDTNRCVADCPQGDGSAADSKKYADCQQACYSSHFFPGTQGSAATETESAGTETGSSGTETGSSGTETGSSGTETGSSGTETGSSGTTSTGVSATETTGSSTGFQTSSNGPTRTGESANGSSTGGADAPNSAASVKMGASGAALFGLALAAFAL